MKRLFLYLIPVVSAAGACSHGSGGGVKLKTDLDSVAYVIGMNVGLNLQRMDSTLNAEAVCEGIRDVFRGKTRMTMDDAETFYLSYVNYALPEKARAYEEQFLADIAKSNRSYARTSSGVTYTVEEVGDQDRIPTSDRDSVAVRWVIRTGRYGSVDAPEPQPGRAGEPETDRCRRTDPGVAAGRHGLRCRGRCRTGHCSECHALLRDRVARCG